MSLKDDLMKMRVETLDMRAAEQTYLESCQLRIDDHNRHLRDLDDAIQALCQEPAPLRDQPPESAGEVPEGWIKHDGGECPVEVGEAIVTFTRGCGEWPVKNIPEIATHWSWSGRVPHNTDILAYKYQVSEEEQREWDQGLDRLEAVAARVSAKLHEAIDTAESRILTPEPASMLASEDGAGHQAVPAVSAILNENGASFVECSDLYCKQSLDSVIQILFRNGEMGSATTNDPPVYIPSEARGYYFLGIVRDFETRGARDGEDGKSLDDCPYPEHSRARELWRLGWLGKPAAPVSADQPNPLQAGEAG